MDLIDRELTAAKEAGVTVEQVQAITAEARKRQNEPIDQKDLWRALFGDGDYCTLCGAWLPVKFPTTVQPSFRQELKGKHWAWHNQLEVRLRKLEKQHQD